MILLEKYIIIGRKWIEQHILNDTLQHHGVKGQKWGERNGPPYPIKRIKNANGDTILLVNRTELYGPPNGITQRTGKKVELKEITTMKMGDNSNRLVTMIMINLSSILLAIMGSTLTTIFMMKAEN